jgi:hypothetical protein
MAKQLELDFGVDKTPRFSEWLREVNSEHQKHGERLYCVDEGRLVYNELVKRDFFNKQSNYWNPNHVA